MASFVFPAVVRAGFASQHGVSDLAAFRTAGVSDRQRKKLISAQIIESMARGVYQSGTAERTELAMAAAGCHANGDLVTTGPTGGRLWGLRRLPKHLGRAQFLAGPGSNHLSASWAEVFRCGVFDPSDVVTRPDGIRLTSPPVTAVHLARFVDDDDLASIVEQLLHQFCTLGTLRAVAARFATRGRPWARRFAQIVNSHDAGAAAESHGEHLIFEALIRAGLPVISRQHWLNLPDGRRARLDIVDETVRWGVEIDLHPSHEGRSGVAADKVRDRQCHLLGWQIERVTSADFGRFDRTIAELVELHCRRSQSTR